MSRDLSDEARGARMINNRFGEGASPRLRQIREGLNTIGIESTHVLQHATPRIVYGCELYPDARLSLLSLVDGDNPKRPSVQAIGRAWRRRWLAKRIERQGTIDRLRRLGPDSISASLQTVVDIQTD